MQTYNASADPEPRLLCHALQFAFKSISYYIRRATLINVRPHPEQHPLDRSLTTPSSPV